LCKERNQRKLLCCAVTILSKPLVAQALDDTLTAAEVKIVRRGEAQLKRGKSKPWRDVKPALVR
jgi:hypothetical protein